jgi:Tfp pilus assembly protein PilF
MPRREQLEEMLKSDPDDTFLNYALALEDLSAGDRATGMRGLEGVIARDPRYVAAYFRLGKARAEADDLDGARQILRDGIAVARQVGDTHAAGEMTGFLEMLG